MAPESTFAKWLRTAMPQHGYPLEGRRAGGISRLADDAGVSRASMSRIVNGQGEPSVDSLRRIGKILGYTLAQMMVFAGLTEPDIAEADPHVGQPALRISEPTKPGVQIEQVGDSHLQVGMTIETEPDLTLTDVEERLAPLSPNEKAMIANMEAMDFPPAEIGGAVLMLREMREFDARRTGTQPNRPRRRA